MLPIGASASRLGVVTVTLTISTPDEAPTAAPYKVSRVTGSNTASVSFTVTGTGPVRAWRLKRGGVNVATGVDVRGKGGITGLSKCGATYSVLTAFPTPKTISLTIDGSELPTEGANAMSLYVYNGSVFE